MGDPEPKDAPPAPAEERDGPSAQHDAQPEPDAAHSTLDHARRFLREEAVQRATREEKAEFLRTKGIDDADIETLLDEESNAEESLSTPSATTTPDIAQENQAPATDEKKASSSSSSPQQPSEPADGQADRAPIVTYPEFLARAPRPPPLVTPTGFMHTVSAFAGVAALVYGASQYVLAPMVASLTDARIELHEHAAKGLDSLVAKLEETVSEIPPAAAAVGSKAHQHPHAAAADSDEASSCGDPTEVFHRDIGVQTESPVRTPSPSGRPRWQQQQQASPAEAQARRVSDLAASLRDLNRGLVSQSEEYTDTKAVLNVFKDDLARLSRPYPGQFGSGYSIYGGSSRQEPNDEIKTVKENIRRVKGLLLSTRSFPAATR